MGASSGGGANPRALRVLVDTSVVLDLLLRREPWVTQSQLLIEASASGRVIGHLPTSALTDVFYIGRRLVGIERAFEAVDRCLADFQLLPVDRSIVESARLLPGNDFEDNVQIACAAAAQLDLIVTRDAAGFTHSPIPAVEPATIVSHLDRP